MKKMLQIVIILVIFNSLLFYLGWNIWEWLKVAFGFQSTWIFSLIYFIISYSYLIARGGKYLSFFRPIGSIWFGVIQYGLVIFPIANISVFLLHFLPIALENIIFWTGIVVILLLFVIFTYGIFNAYSTVVRKYQITVPKKHGTRNSLRVAVASDMHFGRLSGVSHVKRLVRNVNDIKPDIILLPGDIIDDELKPFVEKQMGLIMRELKAPLGVYGVLGNHEYYGGDLFAFSEEMKKNNITILMDEVVTIEKTFYLVGRNDKTDRKRKSFNNLLEGIGNSLPIIAMDHQPFELRQAQENGVDILLSGHTHRGQMVPNHLITRKMYELDWGYLKKEQLHAFVSSGFGFWGPPIRIGSRSEILQIDVDFV
ncbi:metallophosphoesterase [Cytobacillus sp. S13-E01]|uniref:metallophosphoesterase n=1 Tax=Cytobacillus sp. S13-E01 TaxID=3031326 RepID=UPI0023D88011|nr:metallophosphoesterase [Cytobacillus sp. S13-E01]MDF0726522.1 metallophosphoesterase [Cytobacillus sp. S13-E01]